MHMLRTLFYGLLALLALIYGALIAIAYWPTGITEVPARQLADEDDRFIDVDGLELRYRTWGEAAPGKPAILLIHGFANSLQSFRRLAPLLASHYHVIAYDMPGYGLSAKPAPFDYGNASQARIAARLIKVLGLRDVVVAGHSLGGAVALRAALLAPEARGLVVMNPGIITTGVPPIVRWLKWPFPRIQAKVFGDEDFRAEFLRQSFVDKDIVTDEVVADLARTAHSEGYLAGMTSLMGQYQEASEPPLLAEVRLPSLVIFGAQDAGKPDPRGEYDTLLAGLRNSEGLWVEESGHYVQEEAPEKTAAAINALAARLVLRGATTAATPVRPQAPTD